jgi:hypothetical protein
MDTSRFLDKLHETTYGWIGLILLITLLVWSIFRIRSWFREDEDPAALDHEMLSRFGELHREGDLSEEEYRLIRSRLVERIDRSNKE